MVFVSSAAKVANRDLKSSEEAELDLICSAVDEESFGTAMVDCVLISESSRAGSFPDLRSVSRKPFTADTAVHKLAVIQHKAVIQQQHSHTAEGQDGADAIDCSPLISSQQEAPAASH
ncbi:TPA: hypothetical protein ACH3X1_002752 [Trebouxia sp. C0004]